VSTDQPTTSDKTSTSAKQTSASSVPTT
jgi:hypothetical protein